MADFRAMHEEAVSAIRADAEEALRTVRAAAEASKREAVRVARREMAESARGPSVSELAMGAPAFPLPQPPSTATAVPLAMFRVRAGSATQVDAMPNVASSKDGGGLQGSSSSEDEGSGNDGEAEGDADGGHAQGEAAVDAATVLAAAAATPVRRRSQYV
jgi:hypothetical protein